MKNNLYDIIDPDIKFALTESDSEVDGVHILAKVKGQFFVPDGKSRNGRYYPKSLWEKVISNPAIKAKLESRMMYGTVGHKKPLTDEALGDGEGSHFMTDMYIDDQGRGIGEAYIIGTPRGKILNTMLRAGSKFSVSSRADGTFKGKHGSLPIVNEDTYSFYNFDFVADPGFLEANPELAESYKELEKLEETEDNINSNKNGETTMSEKLMEHISNENHELKTKVANLTDEVKTLEENAVTIGEETTQIKAELEKLEKVSETLEGFKELGTAEEVREALEKAIEDGEVLEEFMALADSPEEIKEALEKSIEFSEKISEDFGTVSEIQEALETSIEFKENVSELGTVEEIKEALTIFNEELEAKEATKLEESTKVLAEEINMTVEETSELLKKYSAGDIKALRGVKVEESKDEDDNFKKKNFDESKDEVKSEFSESRILGSNRASRISERI